MKQTRNVEKRARKVQGERESAHDMQVEQGEQEKN